ncbi:MAG: glycosyltransferase family 2 protein [Dehalococcoidia bacterium]
MESFTGRGEAGIESAEWTHSRDWDRLEVAISDPFDVQGLDAVASSVGRTPAPSLATRSQTQGVFRAHLRENDRAEVVANLAPEDSASQVLTRGQLACAGLALGLIAGALVLWPRFAIVGLISAAIAFYMVSSVFRLSLILLSVGGRREMVVEPGEVDGLGEDELPFYTVLAPLSREARMLDQLVAALSQLDYPRSKLEVLLLLEEDDTETRAAADVLVLPSFMRVLLVPAGEPRGKPRALNYGLLYARGEYCVIYDAEDVPDPDQLKKAVVAFSRAGDDVVCVQSKLNFYNGEQNILTRLFTLDYSIWFEFVLPGLFLLDAPILLGGTSNHFKVAALRRAGAWDPFNVTEDADLGTRLYRQGYRTVMVDSLTREEANSQLWNWIRQRTHWTKGYMLTYLVHMRHPLRLWRELGALGFISTQLLVGGTVVVQLLNPLFWSLLGLWCATRWSALSMIFTGPILYAGSILIFGATFSFIFSATLSTLRTGQYWAAKYTPLLPLYWALASFASYRALIQLVTSPHHWEKTRHGLFTPSDLDNRGRRQKLRPSPVTIRSGSLEEVDGA